MGSRAHLHAKRTFWRGIQIVTVDSAFLHNTLSGIGKRDQRRITTATSLMMITGLNLLDLFHFVVVLVHSRRDQDQLPANVSKGLHRHAECLLLAAPVLEMVGLFA